MYKFDQTDREVFESTLEEVLGSTDFSGLTSTSDLDKYADIIVTSISTAVDKAISKSKTDRSERGTHYSKIKDPAVKTCINQLRKQIEDDDIRVETQASWETFCNSVSLETDSNGSWGKIKDFLKPKGQRDYPTLRHDDKVTKTNAHKVQNLLKGTSA